MANRRPRGRSTARWATMLMLVPGLSALATSPVGAQGDDTRAAARGAVLEAMDAYIGRWRTVEKQSRDGERFHYEYDLEWIDEGRTIARMLLERVGSSGRTVVFEGYKGREPLGNGVYYFAVSPSGRGARGDVVLEGEDLVTRFEGWDTAGSVVQIRDIFEPPATDGDAFTNRTFLRSDPTAEWRKIAEDRWTRLEAGP